MCNSLYCVFYVVTKNLFFDEIFAVNYISKILSGSIFQLSRGSCVIF